MSALLGLLRDLAVLVGIVLALFCIYETLNPEYERPPLKRRFKLFLLRTCDLLLFHLAPALAVALINACQSAVARFRHPRP